MPINEEVEKEINKNRSEIEKEQANIKNLEINLDSLLSEREKIVNIKNKFALFLKRNTIALLMAHTMNT
ncbi:15524_t:CDS:1, partial [Acaulospora colombiana]